MSINNSAPKNTNSKITAARQPTEDVNNQESTKRYVNEEVIVKFRTPEAIATTDTLATTIAILFDC